MVKRISKTTVLGLDQDRADFTINADRTRSRLLATGRALADATDWYLPPDPTQPDLDALAQHTFALASSGAPAGLGRQQTLPGAGGLA
jgi:hypothetical protein